MIAAFSVSPSGSEEVGAAVAQAVRLVRESGLANETNAMFTNVEGEWEEVMALIYSCVLRLAEDSPRVSLVIKVDYRPGVTGALRSKVETVERHLAESRE
ncbi:MAG: thiamine-binding protein [Acidimicrobiales bacterium]